MILDVIGVFKWVCDSLTVTHAHSLVPRSLTHTRKKGSGDNTTWRLSFDGRDYDDIVGSRQKMGNLMMPSKAGEWK